ncbi:MAG: Bor/Iss family lipoprotein, partial [Planctomycetaceae bacterium]
LWGLVPPETVTTAEQCPDGVARVETMHSFLNSLASALTWGIYTPITIRATCAGGDDNDAAGAADVLVPASATREQRTEAMTRAVTLSAERQAPVYVRFATH